MVSTVLMPRYSEADIAVITQFLETRAADEIVPALQAKGVPASFIGVQPLFDEVRVYEGPTCDVSLVRLDHHPLWEEYRDLRLPWVNRKHVQKATQVCTFIPYIADELPKGAAQEVLRRGAVPLEYVMPDSTPYLAHVAQSAGRSARLAVERTLPTKAEAGRALRIAGAQSVQVGNAALDAAIKYAPVVGRASWVVLGVTGAVAGAILLGVVQAMATADPIVIGAVTLSGTAEPGELAAFIEITRWDHRKPQSLA